VVKASRLTRASWTALETDGAGNETRTRDPDLGKVVLYQLSYSRIRGARDSMYTPWEVKASRPATGGLEHARRLYSIT
jgi:hypothetical protein